MEVQDMEMCLIELAQPVYFQFRTKNRTYVCLRCPNAVAGNGLCTGDSVNWRCAKCKDLVEYGIDTEKFYCRCGESIPVESRFRCNDKNHTMFVSYPSDILNTELSQHRTTKEFNILILGETGVGKSTWINGFQNYLYFDDLYEAKNSPESHVLIPSSFTFTQDGETKLIQIGEQDGNEVMETGKSTTKEPRSYVFYVGGARIRLIDTPGIGDSEGIEQDRKNFDNILSYLTYFDEIHAVCILLKPNNARLTAMFRFCIQELLAQLHSTAKDNIVFCFTNARATFFQPGDTLPALNKELRARKVGIQVRPHNYFCFDNESIRFLACVKNGVHFSQAEIDIFAESWDKSAEETKRLLEYINTELKPHNVRETLSMHEARRIIVAMIKPLTEIAKTIDLNVQSAQRAREQIELADSDIRSLENNLMFAKHMTYDTKVFDEEFSSGSVQKEIQKKRKAKTQKEAAKRLIDTKITELREEEKLIMRTCAKYGSFLKANAVIPYNDAVVDYLDMCIVQEKMKAREFRNTTLLSKMQEMKDEYARQRAILDETIGTEVGGNIRTPEQVKELQRELFQLKHFGQTLKRLFDGIPATNSARNISFGEKIVPVPPMYTDKSNTGNISWRKCSKTGNPSSHSDNPQDAPSAGGNLDTPRPVDTSSIALAPPEILARGPKAYKAYLDATRDSTKAVFRTRLMLVGQERVGKTSLKKSLTGKRFDPHEGVTDGVEINIEVASTEGTKWFMHKKDADDYNTALADNITERLGASYSQDKSTSEIHSEEKDRRKFHPEARAEGYMKTGPAETMKKSENGTQDTLTSTQSGESHESKVKQELSGIELTDETKVPSIGAASEEKTGAPREFQKQGHIPDNIAGLVETMLRKKKLMEAEESGRTDGRISDELSLSIWDFAGHDVYYTTHQVFLTWRAVYILVFDLSRDLDSTVPPEDRGELYTKAKRETQSELTCLEFINFWLCSIYAHAVAPSSKTGKNVNETAQKSPQIFIVGTHREDVKGHRREKWKKIHSAFRKIRNSIKKKPFKHHVVTRYYAIENSLEDRDKELLALMKHIEEVAIAEPYIGEKIPLRWLLFEEAVSASKANYMTLQEVKELVRPVGIESEEELFTMLNFYHDLGTIVYYGDIDDHHSLLRDIVILNPQWLIDVFKQVISIPEFAKRDEFVQDDWNSLENRGILTDKLIKHLWHVQKEAMIEIMLKFDLICEAPAHWHMPEKLDKSDDEDKDVKKSYYVPSRMTSDCSKRDIGQIKSSQDFYVDFRGFLPTGLFHRLMARAVKWFGVKGGKPATLFHRHISKMMEDHQAVLEMLPPHEATIKIAIFRNDVDKENRDVLDDGKHPDLGVVSEVMDFVKESLASLKQHWAKRIHYDFYSACPQCGKRKLLKDSSDGMSPYCRKHRMSKDIAANEESIEMPSKTVRIDSSGGNIEIEQCGIKMEVPPGALKAPVDITLKPLYNPPKFDVSPDEMIVSCGFQCSPGGLQFDEQITVTLSHCAVFSKHVPMQAVLYVCDSDDGHGVYKKILLGSDCTVNQHTVDIRIRHFTRHWVYLLALRSLLRQLIPPSNKIYIIPFLRTLTPASHYDLRVFFCNADRAMLEEIKASSGNKNYEMVDVQTEFRVTINGGDVDVQLETHPAYPSLKIDINIRKTEILHNNLLHRCFDLNFKKMDTNIRVKLFIGQKKLRALNEEQPTYTLTAPVEFVITKNVEATRVQEATPQTRSSDIEEIELMRLARHVPHSKYTELCISLGISFVESESVRSKNQLDVRAALIEILCEWKRRAELDRSSREVLAEKLQEANLDSLGRDLLAGRYKRP